MGFERSMDLASIKKEKKLKQKKDGGQTKYGFGISKDIKGFGVEKSWGLNKFGFDQYKEIKRTEAEKRWGLDEVWIWYQ